MVDDWGYLYAAYWNLSNHDVDSVPGCQTSHNRTGGLAKSHQSAYWPVKECGREHQSGHFHFRSPKTEEVGCGDADVQKRRMIHCAQDG